MFGWRFPKNDDGTESGTSNPGLETFKGDLITSLAREINQNSLDASNHDARRPVEVHFNLETVKSSDFFGKSEFVEVLNSSIEYWGHNKKTINFLNKAKNCLLSNEIKLLRISDFNTTGLTGANYDKKSNWKNLIKGVGVSDKVGDTGGSFGIGKHAAYACSDLSTVFYSTKDIDGVSAFQGVSMLVTHTDSDGDTTQGNGYFGHTDGKKPITNSSDIPETYRRDEVGTDLLIFGFNGGDDWKDKIIKSVLENFFVAIHLKSLVVVVAGVRIDDSTMKELFDKYFDGQASDSVKYYQAYTAEESYVFKLDDFEGMGSVDLHLLQGVNFPKRVAMVRKTGMLLFYKGHFHTPMKFAAVMRATGDELNKFLRQLENPNHDKWMPERHDDPEYAAKTLQKLNNWVRDCVKTASQDGIEEEYDFEGMQQYLPDDLEDEIAKPSDDSGFKTSPKDVEIKFREKPRGLQPDQHKPSDKDGGDGDDDNVTTSDFENEDNDSDVINKEERNDGENGSGDEESGSKENQDSSRSAPTSIPIKLTKVRSFCTNFGQGLYKVIFTPAFTGKGLIQIRIVGEVDEAIAPVTFAQYLGEDVQINSNGLIGPIDFIEDGKQEVIFQLAGSLHCAIEVAAYEN
jgi:hypothetical protein